MKHNIESRACAAKPRILIVGGVAGGASCAARARRLSEKAEIVIFERGPNVSFANCGLPYYVGNVITEEKNLLVATPDLLKKRFNIDVRLQNEVQVIDRKKNEVEVRSVLTGEVYRERYDALVLSPGSSPIRPPLPGIDLPGIFTLRTIPESHQIREWIIDKGVNQAIVIGGGFIGLEMVENLTKLGISVTVIEMLPQVMPAIDSEMVRPVHEHLAANGVSLHLGDAVVGFEQKTDGDKLTVATESGAKFDCDMVILAIGIRPEVTLAREAGLEIGTLGGIRVNEQMRTSDERIWAVGDAIEVRDFITGEWTLTPLAGPANRQGRIAADVILGRNARFRGTQATVVCQIFGMTIASTGVSERVLRNSGIAGRPAHYEKIYLHPWHHAGYYPGAKQITMKLIFSTEDGRILGAQAIGEEGVEKRIDVIAMAIQQGSTVFDLEEAELCYAPQFGTAKDPVNYAGMVAANVLRGDSIITHWEDVDQSQFLLDVREPGELQQSGYLKGALHIPLGSLREHIEELPRDREIIAYCAIGLRSYYAARILHLNQFRARNVSGGLKIHNAQMQFEQ